MSPTVSVITPVFDAAGTLAATVASVRAQTMPDWEMILVDDGSTDGSAPLAAALAAEDARIRLLRLGENRGPAAARNAAIRAAAGRFLAFLDADDLWYPHKLAAQLAVAEAEGVPFLFAAYRRVDAGGRALGTVGAPARVTRDDLLRGNPIGCLTAMYDSHALGKVEMPDLRRRQDWGLWLDLLGRTPYARGMPEVLADYRVRAGSLSANRLAGTWANWVVLRRVGGLPPLQAGYRLLGNARRALGNRRGGGP